MSVKVQILHLSMKAPDLLTRDHCIEVTAILNVLGNYLHRKAGQTTVLCTKAALIPIKDTPASQHKAPHYKSASLQHVSVSACNLPLPQHHQTPQQASCRSC